MLHGDLDGPTTRRASRLGIIQTFDISAGDDLTQTTVLRVSDLDVIGPKQEDIRTVDGRATGSVDVLHHHRSRHVAVFVGIHRAFFVAQQKFRVVESEHPQGFLVRESCGDRRHVWLFQVRHRVALFLVEVENFEASRGGVRQVGAEYVDAEAFGGDVEFVEFPEEFRRAFAGESRFLFCGFVEDGFEYLVRRGVSRRRER